MASFYYPLGVGNVLAVSTAPRACRTLDRGRCRAVPRGVGVVAAARSRLTGWTAGPVHRGRARMLPSRTALATPNALVMKVVVVMVDNDGEW
jgi:hypothetical protein